LPHALAIDSVGRLFVADRGNNRIEIFDQDGKFISESTGATNRGFAATMAGRWSTGAVSRSAAPGTERPYLRRREGLEPVAALHLRHQLRCILKQQPDSPHHRSPCGAARCEVLFRGRLGVRD
jgi:hypothetical protein